MDEEEVITLSEFKALMEELRSEIRRAIEMIRGDHKETQTEIQVMKAICSSQRTKFLFRMKAKPNCGRIKGRWKAGWLVYRRICQE